MSGEIVALREPNTEAITRPPPANIEAEAALLGALLSENRLLDQVADILSPGDFSLDLHARIYETALAEFSGGRAASPVTLRGRFADDEAMGELGGPVYMMRLTADPQGLLAPLDLARHIRELARRRALLAGLDAAREACLDENKTLAEVADLTEQTLSRDNAAASRISSAAECIADLIESFDKPLEGIKSRSIPSFDDLHGLMEPSQMIVLAGRPGMGKTATGLSYSLGAAKQGHGVLFVSLEMNRRQLAGRLAADLCFEAHRIPYAAIRDRRVNAEDRKKLAEAWQRICSLPLSIADVSELSTGALHAMVRSHGRRYAAQGKKLELVVVDYLQLLRPSQKTNGRYDAVSEVSRSLKAIAKDCEVPVLALAQLSRANEARTDKRPQLSDLRDSGQIEQDADSVMFVHREEYYLNQAKPMESSEKFPAWEAGMDAVKGRIEFILAKRRNGVTGVAEGAFFGAYQAVR